MKNTENQILRSNEEKNIRIVGLNNFKTDAGWQENMSDLEKETLEQIINPAQNFETVRYIHSPYSGITSSTSKLQSDIWFYFYFSSGSTYVQNYEPTGLTLRENYKMLRQSTESFFRLEFFKTPNDDSPDRTNRRLVLTKNLSLPISEKVFYTGDNLNEYVFVPVFMGSNYVNKENMYLFWFQDDSVFDETTLTGNTFWMTAKYFNAKTGTITDFVNTCLSTSTEIDETTHMYYKVIIDRTDYSYKVYEYDGTVGSRIGQRNNPIVFYQTGGGTC